MTKNCRHSISGFALTKEKNTSKAIIKRYAGIEFLYLAPFSRIRCCFTNFDNNDSGFHIKICNHFLNSLSNPPFLNMHITKE